ncbi:Uncharacterised protein [Mycobacteroides abscessus]|nr:Uncharacterised protein [Mycobacteroides abscessus]
MHAPHLREALSPRQLDAQLVEHAAAGFHRCQLVGVTNEHGFRLGGGSGLQQLAQLGGGHHGRLIDDHHGALIEGQGAGVELVQRFVEGHAVVAGAVSECLIDRRPGGSEHQHLFVDSVGGGAQGLQGVGFSGTGGCGQRIDQPLRHADRGHRARLIR